DVVKAKEIMADLARVQVVESKAESYAKLADEVRIALELARDAEDSGDAAEATMMVLEAKSTIDMWQAELSDAEVQMLMGGSYDAESCQFTIFAGVGGDE
ncbi:unnamed protein product, partial [Polarella glacialis]